MHWTAQNAAISRIAVVKLCDPPYVIAGLRDARHAGTAGDFGDGKLAIPERKNHVPDILDEARWELEFELKMQVPAGQPLVLNN